MKLINKEFTKLSIATFITRFGDSVDSIAFSWLVYVMTGSRELMGAIFAISILPNIIVLPFAGVLADTFNRKKLTIIGDVSRGISVTILAIFYFYGILEVWHLFMFVILNSLFESVANPARGSMLQALVNDDEYVKANGYLSSASNLGGLIGISLAAVFIGLLGIWGAILIDGITFFVSAIIIFIIHYTYEPPTNGSKQKIKDFFVMIKEGFVYIGGKKFIIGLMILGAFINFAFVPVNVLQPVYVTEVLNLGVEGLTYLGLAILIGMTLGGLIMGKFADKVNPIKSIVFGLMMMGIMYALLGFVDFFTFNQTMIVVSAVIFAALFGLFLPIIQAPIQGIIMKKTPPEMMGRQSSIFGIFALISMPLGGALVSIIGDSLKVSTFFIAMGTAIVIIAMIYYSINRKTVV